MLKRTHRFEPKVFLRTERRDDGPLATGVNEELQRRGWLFDYGRGHVALSGPALALAQLIDAKAAELYVQHFRAEPRSFPAFVDADILHRCGYFDSHPNAISFVGHMVEDFDAIEAFRQANSCAEGALMPGAEHVHLPGLCLNPAACFPCYPTLEGRRIGEDGAAFSWKGRVFRYKSRNLAGLDRLWEFNVRELVLRRQRGARRRLPPPRPAGDRRARRDVRPRVPDRDRERPVLRHRLGRADLLAARAGGEERDHPADRARPGRGAARAGLRLDQPARQVLRRPLRHRRRATASAAATGCVGLGIERWVLAAFSQHGFEPERWPAAVRRAIFG